MKRTERVAAIVHILGQHPNVTLPMNFFCQHFQAAKSTISEDISMARSMLDMIGGGHIETMTGAKGGIRYVPDLPKGERNCLLERISEKMNESSRVLGGGFFYNSDLMFDASIIGPLGTIFARHFEDAGAEAVVTVESKGIPVALMTARALHIPLVVVRREAKVSDGSSVSINYFSGSSDRYQKMFLSKRALKAGSKVLIIDDFMRAGGSLRGLSDMMKEFECDIVGIGVVMVSREPEQKRVKDYFPLLYLDRIDEEQGRMFISANPEAL